MRRWLWFNSLALAMFGAFLVFIVLQAVFGWQYSNDQAADFGGQAQSFWSYLGTGDFVEATFENWESEFLQIGSYIMLTAFLVQKGSPESNPLDGKDDNPEDPAEVKPDSPRPVRRGGPALAVYSHSLSIVIFGLFLVSFVLHVLGGTAAHNEEAALIGQPAISVGEFFGSSEFWFQSMQNWQSEFLSVGVLIVATIVLRERNSAQSKKVAEPHAATGT